MSKKVFDPQSEVEPAADPDDSSSSGGKKSPLQCPKCNANKIAYSRLQRFDGLKMRFMAKRPYRCLHCYHRFWVAEKFADSGKRVWTFIVIAIVIALLLLKLLSASESNERVSVIVPELNQSETSGDSTPSLASLINAPQSTSGENRATVSVENVSNTPNTFAGGAEEALTAEQKARRLILAKQEAEAAEKLSQQRVEQLEKTLLPAEDELESLVKVEVGYVVERWRDAWSKGDIDRYLLSYSSDFTPPNDLNLEAWKASRKSRVIPEKNISVDLSDFDISMLEELNSGVVEFNQRYQSGSYIENSRKRLSLIKENGSWKIASEVEIEQ